MRLPVPPVLVGPGGVRLRPLTRGDHGALLALRRDPTVARWWGDPDPDEVARAVAGADAGEEVLLGIEVDGILAGGIAFHEEAEPDYRHAGIDVFVGAAHQGRGVGTEAVRTLARWLVAPPPAGRGHHRLVIDPAVANTRAVRAYEKVGFRPVGVMRRYERAPDGTWRDGLLMDALADEVAGPGPDVRGR